jgi:hypothetical protein
VVNSDKASRVGNPVKVSEAISQDKASRVVNLDSNSPRRAVRVRQTMKQKIRIATVNAAHPSFLSKQGSFGSPGLFRGTSFFSD